MSVNTTGIADVVRHRGDGRHYVRLMGHIVLEVDDAEAGKAVVLTLDAIIQAAFRQAIETGAKPAGVLRRAERPGGGA